MGKLEMIIRGYETSQHVYIKRLIMETLHEMGAVVAEEAIFPNSMRADVIGILNGQVYFFEVMSMKGTSYARKKRAMLNQKYGKGGIVYYDPTNLPTRSEIWDKVRKVLMDG